MTKHLIHIGYPKAGSTFLQRWFEAHPQVAYAEGGLAGFRNVYAIQREVTGQEAPRIRVTSSEGLLAPRREAWSVVVDYDELRKSSTGTARQRACTLLAELFPGASILIVTRGFRSMILSSYSQYARTGGSDDLATLVASVNDAAIGGQDPWDYDAHVTMYRREFGPENVIVMPYELLRDDPVHFTSWLARRLSIDESSVLTARVNESLSASEMAWYPRFARMVRRTRSRRLQEWLARLSFTNRLRPVICILGRLAPGALVTESAISDEFLNRYRGRAEALRGDPLYLPYAREYLLD
jgi:hypothetical protein